MKRCEIGWCGKKTDKPVYVNENIGDGSWRVCICQDCAIKLGLKAGDDLPSTPEIKRRLGIACPSILRIKGGNHGRENNRSVGS